MVKVKNLHKSFEDLHVLKGIGLEVQKGEVVVVIGPSGSGKSTFLRCINHLERPTSGAVSYTHLDVYKRQIAFWFVARCNARSAPGAWYYNRC